MKIAVVGSGISGLISAYTLQKQHEVTLYESRDYLGGHTNTVDVKVPSGSYAVDTGFIVFNDRTYPNFIKFLNKINAPWKNTEMSFSVFDSKGNFEYNGNNLNTLFAQRKNIFKFSFYRFIAEIIRFNNMCKDMYEQKNISTDKTLGDFLQKNKFSQVFNDYYLLPMVSAIWSSTYKEASDFPLNLFIRFFYNHGLLNINDRPQWHVIKGGSREYVKHLTKQLQVDVRLSTPVLSIRRHKDFVELKSKDGTTRYDHVILAGHSDQSLKVLADPSNEEIAILSKIKYQKNEVTLHTDITMLPKNKRAWASWNYKIQSELQRNSNPSTVSYNMNILQGIESPETFVVSLNQNDHLDESKILKKLNYYHPVFSKESEEAKSLRGSICGVKRTHFCGAYWHNGFHEDGVNSALDVVKRFGVSL